MHCWARLASYKYRKCYGLWIKQSTWLYDIIFWLLFPDLTATSAFVLQIHTEGHQLVRADWDWGGNTTLSIYLWVITKQCHHGNQLILGCYSLWTWGVMSGSWTWVDMSEREDASLHASHVPLGLTFKWSLFINEGCMASLNLQTVIVSPFAISPILLKQFRVQKVLILCSLFKHLHTMYM